MGEKIEREIERFDAVDDSGTKFIIIEHQTFIDATHLESDGREWIAGLKRWELPNGVPVNKVDDKTYLVVSTNTKVKRLAANTPSNSD